MHNSFVPLVAESAHRIGRESSSEFGLEEIKVIVSSQYTYQSPQIVASELYAYLALVGSGPS